MPAQAEPMGAGKYWSRGRLQPVTTCPACGSNMRIGKPLRCYDHRTPLRDDHWSMYRCLACHSLYLDPRPDDQSLPKVYDAYYTHIPDGEQPATSGLSGLLWRLIHGYLNARFGMARSPALSWGRWLFGWMRPWRMKLDYYGRHLYTDSFPQRGQLLDVGCGNGAFLARAREMGWRVSGLEPDPKAVETCYSQGLDVLQGELGQSPAQWNENFDVITMSHCIEHVVNPKLDLKLAYRLLRPGGVLWLACPNPRSLGSLFYGRAWRELHPPYHLIIPSLEQLSQMLLESGFIEIEAVKRGIHARRALRESAENAYHAGGLGMKIRSTLAPAIRVLADLAATLSVHGGEEIVIIARRGM